MTSALAIQALGFTNKTSRLSSSQLSVDLNLHAIRRAASRAASRVATDMVYGSCAVEPVVSWQSALEPIVSALANVQAVHEHWAEQEGFVLLDEEDLPLPEYCQRALDALDYYDELEDDWDEEGASAPLRSSTRDARYFLRVLCNQIVDAPTIRPMLDTDGISGFFWSDEKNYLSISFYGDFSLTFLFKNKESDYVSSGTVSLEDAEQIAELLAYIEAI